MSKRNWTEIHVTSEVIKIVKKRGNDREINEEEVTTEGFILVNRKGKVVEEVFEESLEPIIQSSEEDEISLANHKNNKESARSMAIEGCEESIVIYSGEELNSEENTVGKNISTSVGKHIGTSVWNRTNLIS